MSLQDDKIELIKRHVKSYPNFPKSGVLFRDIFSVLQEPKLFSMLRDVLCEHVRSIEPLVDHVVGLEARGFLIGPIIALELQIPFVPIRKKGKLPGNIKSVCYKLEYGEDVIEIQEGSITKGSKVLLVDDLLATGGSLCAACKLVESMEAEVVECLVVMELGDLNGRNNLPVPVHSLLAY